MSLREMPALATDRTALDASPPWAPAPSPLERRWQAERDRHTGLHATVLEEDEDGAVRLGGRVRTQYLKQVAFAVAVEVAGDRRIINAIQVVPYGPRVEPSRAAFDEPEGG